MEFSSQDDLSRPGTSSARYMYVINFPRSFTWFCQENLSPSSQFWGTERDRCGKIPVRTTLIDPEIRMIKN